MNLSAGGETLVVRRPDGAAQRERTGHAEQPGWPDGEASLLAVVVGAPTLLRDCVVSVLDQQDGVRVAGVAATVDEAQAAVLRARPHIVVVDPRRVEGEGLAVIARLRDADPDVRVLVVCEDQSPQTLQRVFQAGAHSVVCPWCTGDDVVDAVRRTAAGQTVVGPDLMEQLVAAASAATSNTVDLSAREREVLEHISCGATNAEIASQLDVSIRTVQKHLENLFRQFAVHERAALVAEAFRRDLLS